MMYARRMAVLRVTAMAALSVSALLTYDSLHPDRAFCPLAEACEKARSSPLGEMIPGLPTSVLGMIAFGALYLLTLLPLEWARPVLRPAGFLAAISGAVFFGYQALVLKSYCPLCLVADTAGLIAGLVTLTWPSLPRRRSGRRLGGETGASRMAWILAAVLAVVLPFAWPRAEKPGFVEIDAPSEDLFADEPAPPAQPPPPEPAPTTPPPTPAPAPVSAAPTPPPVLPTLPPSASPLRPTPDDGNAVPPPAPAPALVATPAPRPAPAPSVAPPVAKPEVTIVEYLNAYCPHCRVTHKRLDKVLAELGVNARRRQVYTWASNDYPFWARACAYAQTVGLEQRFFAELLEARSQDPSEVFAAARRAGLDVRALQQAAQDPTPPPRLVRDRQLFLQAGLQGMPTLDIGRRRLMGEQSEAELRSAVQAALALSSR